MPSVSRLIEDLRRPRQLFQSVCGSAVGWSWIFNGLRLAAGLFLLPLVVKILPEAEFGMYYVLASISAMVPLVDFGFAPTIGRFVSYAMGGATSLQAHGVAQQADAAAPNFTLLWHLLHTTRKLYRYMTLAVLVVLGIWGTYLVELRIEQTSSVAITRIAWAVTLVAALFDIYSNWWVVYLRNLNQVLVATRIAAAGMVIRVLVAALLLLYGFGLISIPLGSLLGSSLQRFFARRRVLEILKPHPQPETSDTDKHFRVLWPNTWRLGLQLFSNYLATFGNTAVCTHFLGLSANGRYGLSVQLFEIAIGMAVVWTSVKWPLISQYRARHDLAAIRATLWPRVWLQNFTYLLLAAGVLALGPWLLRFLGSGKQMLPFPWMLLLASNGFFLLQFNLWGTLISIENRLPYLWPTVITNVLSLVASLALIRFTSLGIGALVLGPFLAGILFNYWYWPFYSARNLGTSLIPFLFTRPHSSEIVSAVPGRTRR
jgi:O-antigen/teichoic acid export membrane protein